MKKNRNSNPKNKIKPSNLIIIAILGVSIVGVAIFGIAFAPFDISNLYIRGNDVIKGFSLDSFDGEPLSDGGNVPSLGMRFNVETGAYWIIGEDDINIINTVTSEDKTEIEIRYSIIAKNKINFYTNVRLEDATSKNLNVIPEDFLAGKFIYYGCFGTAPSDVLHAWESYITWSHYDFGADWRSWNNEKNVFSGDLKASFDVNPSPLPPFFEDDEGNVISTIYDYIGVYAVVVSDNTHGLMSVDKPDFNIITPEEYDQAKENEEAGGDPVEDMPGDLDYRWNPRPDLSDVVGETFDVGILPHTKGATLNPTTKDGNTIWDPSDPYQSTEDCEFTYSLGSLSPLITKYTSTLTWYEQDLEVQDRTRYVPPLGIEWYIHILHDEEFIRSQTRDVGIHINNRYIQSEIQIEFDVWSKFDISSLLLNETVLDAPEEYYDELLWNLLVDGWGGGTTYIEAPAGIDLTELMTLIIIIAIVIAGIYIFIVFGMPLILKKQATGMIKGKIF